MLSHILIPAAIVAYVGIHFRIGLLRMRARRGGDVQREARLAALGFQMMVGVIMLALVIAIATVILNS